ncbi:SGNH/GDSL hydrolase family protein [Chitinimonas sp. PSY-7]|uniref:SGNH/GDSL hydrolase family protein n=1 Tax=Chitinimonas sp. PSY-7 TaxID=3459088 RepID=UPI00403FE4B8
MSIRILLSFAILISWAHAEEMSTKSIQPDHKLEQYLPLHSPDLNSSAALDAAIKRSANTQKSNTYTYLRCYYLTGNRLMPTTDYVWATDPVSNDYYRVSGYWWSSISSITGNMFYSDITQAELNTVCEQTLRRQGLNPEVTMLAAANNKYSFNYSIWSIDSTSQSNRINKIIVFGDSLSDTMNMFNNSEWRLPNKKSWYRGHFSNGPVWVEYLAKELKLPMYNWAVGGAGSDREEFVIPGLAEQVQSWKVYMQEAPAYRPENTLFTVLIGGNDFINYHRTVEHAINEQKIGLQNLINSGARNILLLNLPDLSRTPVFQGKGAPDIAAQVLSYNSKLIEMISDLKVQNGGGLNIQLFDSYSLFNDLLNNPSAYGMTNTTLPCLNINGAHVSTLYLTNHQTRPECKNPDTFVFWDVLHPTTRTHKLLSDHVAPFLRSHFPLAHP